MTAPKIPEADFLRLYEEMGPTALAKHLNQSPNAVFRRRANLEAKLGRQINGPEHQNQTRHHIAHPHRIELDVRDGVVLVGGDAHYWPGPASTGHRGFVHFIKRLKPPIVIQNGDVFDGASVSRHPPIGWASQPTVQEEIEACQERMGEIEAAAGKARKIHCLGNHDARFETRIASVAPQYAKVAGVSLQDHFPLWEPCWAVWINDSVVVKHRFKGGIHAPWNNTLYAGKTIVTNHLHSGKVIPFTDYNGTRYGVDPGCLADTYGEQFRDYTEDSPRNWRSGFCVLTFRGGQLLYPELVLVWDETHVQFRGELIEV